MPFAQQFRVVVDCPDAEALAGFYQGLLGGTVEVGQNGWVALNDTGGVAALDFQQVEDFQPPTWPGGPAPVQLHLDFYVDDLEATAARASAAGATRLEVQPNDHCLVFADPAGHPFCLSTWGVRQLFDS